MTPASEYDITAEENKHFNSYIENEDSFFHCRGLLDEVKANVESTGYPTERIQYHVGDICKNTYVPEKIAILRLDTDFYESTKHELEQFYDAVVPGGFVIIDDYGFWKGCRKAVDEWIQTKHPEIKLSVIDETGVFFRKPL
jgi:hypothetical protein